MKEDICFARDSGRGKGGECRKKGDEKAESKKPGVGGKGAERLSVWKTGGVGPR